jgi:molybdopterin molybdotransferase
VAAGDGTHVEIQAGQAIRINTGAPMPDGADAVAPIEVCAIDESGDRVMIATVLRAGQHVALRGTDRHAGDLLLASPMTIEAAQIGALATAGLGDVRVYPNVDVGIVVTGNEIVPVGEPCPPGRIHDSNGPMLASLMRQFGASPRNLGIARDDADDLRSKLQTALASPVVVTVGGMSMGTLDLVPKTFVDLGVGWHFHGVRMRPGKPVAYGRGPDGQHVFGLPGNPVSAFVCAWLFVRMAVRGLSGHPVAPPHRWRATLMRAIEPKRDARPAFVPARIWHHADAGLIAEPCAWGGSGDPFGLATANALLVLDDPTHGRRVDDVVEVISISAENW